MIQSRSGAIGAAIGGVALILVRVFVCFRSIERYYYAYGPATDDLAMRHINVTLEISAWAITVAFVVSGIILFRLAKVLNRSN
jgi:hypothetical protein